MAAVHLVKGWYWQDTILARSRSITLGFCLTPRTFEDPFHCDHGFQDSNVRDLFRYLQFSKHLTEHGISSVTTILLDVVVTFNTDQEKGHSAISIYQACKDQSYP